MSGEDVVEKVRTKTLREFYDTCRRISGYAVQQDVEVNPVGNSHPSLEVRGGIDPDSPTYFSDLGETRGD